MYVHNHTIREYTQPQLSSMPGRLIVAHRLADYLERIWRFGNSDTLTAMNRDKLESLLPSLPPLLLNISMHTADSCFELVGSHQCSLAQSKVCAYMCMLYNIHSLQNGKTKPNFSVTLLKVILQVN